MIENCTKMQFLSVISICQISLIRFVCRIKHYMLVLFNYQDFTFRHNHLRAIFLSIIYEQQYLLLDNFSHLSLLLWHKSNGRLI